MSLGSLCNKTGTFYAKSTTAGPLGGKVNTDSVLYADVPLTIQPASGRTIEQCMQRKMIISHVGYTEQELAIPTGATLVSNGITYTVEWFGDEAGRGRVFSAYLMEKR